MTEIMLTVDPYRETNQDMTGQMPECVVWSHSTSEDTVVESRNFRFG